MAPSDVEIVLLRQLASCLRIPIAILDEGGNVRFFNEPAESIFGFYFEEVGGLDAEAWPELLQPRHASGAPLEAHERPVLTALEKRIPGHRRLVISNAERAPQEIELTAIPLVATGERFLGALALFWIPETAPRGPGTQAPEAGLSVEMILTRRLASTLATPIFVVAGDGRLVYYNPAAEEVLGGAFEDARKPSRRQLYESFRPRDAGGNLIDPSEHPLSIARLHRVPVHDRSRIRGRDGRDRDIAVTAIPLIGQSDRQLGAFGIFWEIGQP